MGNNGAVQMLTFLLQSAIFQPGEKANGQKSAWLTDEGHFSVIFEQQLQGYDIRSVFKPAQAEKELRALISFCEAASKEGLEM